MSLIPRLFLRASSLHTECVRHVSVRRISTAGAKSEVDAVYKRRHHWTKDEDKTLLDLVDKHGTKWSLVRDQMNLDINRMGYRRRWEVLQSTNRGKWTLAEDLQMRQVVRTLRAESQKMGEHGWWVSVADALGTGRSPRDCHLRWHNALKSVGGAVDTPVRLPGIRINGWAPDERQRLKDAVNLLTQVSDSEETARAAEEKEPWLVLSARSSSNLPRGFWNQVAELVGARTAQQCRTEWAFEKRRACERGQKIRMTVKEILLMERMVARHGNKWEYIRAQYLPHIPAEIINETHLKWEQLQATSDTNLLDIDPDKILVDYKGGSAALRPTGADGTYDPNGELCLVRSAGVPSCMTPFRLAVKQVGPSKKQKGPQHFIPARYRDSYTYPGLQRAEFYDRLIASVKAHGVDWVAVGKDMKLPPFICYRIAKRLAEITPAVKVTSPKDALASTDDTHSPHK